jgi:hypothetical protein
VNAVDLRAVAELVGVVYEEREMLSPRELWERFDLVIESACRFMRQVPAESLSHSSPDRDRSFRALGIHIMQIPAAFLGGYETGKLSLRGRKLPDNASTEWTGEDIARFGAEMRRELADWWHSTGAEDPMDRVIETYWGAHTLHEAMERETWHSAQHTRQVMMFLQQLEIAPDRPLTAEDLAGLPMPEEVWG